MSNGIRYQRASVIGVLALVGGCTTSLSAIRTKPAADSFQSSKSISAIVACVRASQPGDRSVQSFEEAGATEVVIIQESAGAVMHLRLTAITSGTDVVFRKKGSLVNYDDQVRACYR